MEKMKQKTKNASTSYHLHEKQHLSLKSLPMHCMGCLLDSVVVTTTWKIDMRNLDPEHLNFSEVCLSVNLKMDTKKTCFANRLDHMFKI